MKIVGVTNQLKIRKKILFSFLAMSVINEISFAIRNAVESLERLNKNGSMVSDIADSLDKTVEQVIGFTVNLMTEIETIAKLGAIYATNVSEIKEMTERAIYDTKQISMKIKLMPKNKNVIGENIPNARKTKMNYNEEEEIRNQVINIRKQIKNIVKRITSNT